MTQDSIRNDGYIPLSRGYIFSPNYSSAFSSALTDIVFVLKWPTLSVWEHLGESTMGSPPLSVVSLFHTEMLN